MDHPSRVLAQAREHLEALKQSGLSRDALLALLEEDSQQQQRQQAMLAEGMKRFRNNVYALDINS